MAAVQTSTQLYQQLGQIQAQKTQKQKEQAETQSKLDQQNSIFSGLFGTDKKVGGDDDFDGENWTTDENEKKAQANRLTATINALKAKLNALTNDVNSLSNQETTKRTEIKTAENAEKENKSDGEKTALNNDNAKTLADAKNSYQYDGTYGTDENQKKSLNDILTDQSSGVTSQDTQILMKYDKNNDGQIDDNELDEMCGANLQDIASLTYDDGKDIFGYNSENPNAEETGTVLGRKVKIGDSENDIYRKADGTYYYMNDGNVVECDALGGNNLDTVQKWSGLRAVEPAEPETENSTPTDTSKGQGTGNASTEAQKTGEDEKETYTDPAGNKVESDTNHEQWQDKTNAELKDEVANLQKQVRELKSAAAPGAGGGAQGGGVQGGGQQAVQQGSGSSGGGGIGSFFGKILGFPFKLVGGVVDGVGDIFSGIGNLFSGLFGGGSSGSSTTTYIANNDGGERSVNGATGGSLSGGSGGTTGSAPGVTQNSEPGFFSKCFGGFKNFIGWNDSENVTTFKQGDKGSSGLGRWLRSTGEVATLGMAGDLNGDGTTNAFGTLGAVVTDTVELPFVSAWELAKGAYDRF